MEPRMLNIISEAVQQHGHRDVTVATVRSGSLLRNTTLVRQRAMMAITLLRPELTLAQIAVPFACDPTSVKHAVKREGGLIEWDARERGMLDRLVARFETLKAAAPNLVERLADAKRALDVAGAAVIAARDALDLAEARHA